MNSNQKINEIGKTSGAFLSIIPFYYYIKQILIFSSLKKFQLPEKIKSRIKTNTVVTTILFVLTVIAFCISFSYLMFMLEEFVEEMYYSIDVAINEVRYDSLDDLLVFVIFNIISILFVLATVVCALINGSKINSFLNSEESLELTPSQRFELSKYTGASFAFIPLYIIIKTFTSFSVVKESYPQYIKYFITIIFLFIVNIVLSVTNSVTLTMTSQTGTLSALNILVSIISSIMSIIIPILYIVTGVKLSTLFSKEDNNAI